MRGAPTSGFAHLALTIGMTFQMSDTSLTTKPIHRMTLCTPLLSSSMR